MSDQGEIRTSIDDGVMTIVMARPGKKNALITPLYRALAAALAAASKDEAVRVVLIHGDGADFSAGNDLSEFAETSATGAPAPIGAGDFIRALAVFDKPLVAAVRGVAIGIGLTLLLHCDHVVVAEDARLAAPFGVLGVTPEAASSLLLPARIGHLRAFSVFALGETLDGRAAAALGLANVAVPSDQVLERAQAAARTIASRSPAAMRATKAQMRDAEAVLAHVERELAEFEVHLRSPEALAAFQAFAARSK